MIHHDRDPDHQDIPRTMVNPVQRLTVMSFKTTPTCHLRHEATGSRLPSVCAAPECPSTMRFSRCTLPTTGLWYVRTGLRPLLFTPPLEKKKKVRLKIQHAPQPSLASNSFGNDINLVP